MEKKFKGLRIIANVFKVLAWVILVVSVIFSIIVILGGSLLGVLAGEQMGPMGALTGIFGGIILLIYGVFLFLSLYAGAEVILVLLAIEENTRKPV
ncbi:MAG: hypothetical protein ABIL05_04440 [candidate division WOR-3 bacterium]